FLKSKGAMSLLKVTASPLPAVATGWPLAMPTLSKETDTPRTKELIETSSKRLETRFIGETGFCQAAALVTRFLGETGFRGFLFDKRVRKGTADRLGARAGNRTPGQDIIKRRPQIACRCLRSTLGKIDISIVDPAEVEQVARG